MSFLSFWRCIVCSGRSSSWPASIMKLNSSSFRISPFSSLSSSSLSQITPPLNVISDFLTRECGFSSSQVTAVMRRFPQLLRTKSDHTAREAIHLLKDYGFTANKLKSFIIRAPCILVYRVDSQWKPKMEFLQEIGLSSQDVAHIIFRRPRLLSLSLEDCLAPRILLLETLFGSKVSLCKALRIAPVLLTVDFEKQVKPKVEYVKNRIGISEVSTSFMRALSVAINFSFETLEAKTKHMASLGLAEEEICRILKGCPQVLHLSTNNMKESIDFLIQTAGFEPRVVTFNPMILSLSIEKRLKPRYGVFKSLSKSPHVKSLPSLLRFFRLSEQKYLEYVGQYSSKSSPTIIQSPKESIFKQ